MIKFRMKGADFYNTIHDTVFAASTKPMRIGGEIKSTMEHVKLEFTDTKLRAIASDGRRIATREFDCELECDAYETLIYRKDANAISKKFKRSKEIHGYFDGDTLVINDGGETMSVYHKPHDEYAKWRQVVPEDLRLHRTLYTCNLKGALSVMFDGITAKMISHDRRCVRMVFEGGDDNTVLWLEPGDNLIRIAQNTIKDNKGDELPQAMEDIAMKVPRLVQSIPRIEDTFHIYISPTYLLDAVKAIPDSEFTFAHNYDNDSNKRLGDVYDVLYAIALLPTPFDTSKPFAESDFLHVIMPMRPQ